MTSRIEKPSRADGMSDELHTCGWCDKTMDICQCPKPGDTKLAGMQASGIEVNETYCKLAVKRLAQGVLRLDNE